LSGQLPETQSPATEHVCPLLFLHAPVASHAFVPEQVAPDVSSALTTETVHRPPVPQFLHWGQLDCVQHTLSRQVSPDWHSPVPAQAAPAALTKLAVTDFATGKVAMILNQNNADATIASNGMSSDKYGVVAFPAPKGAKTDVASHVAGINISIYKNTKYKDESLKFVKYMTSAAVQAQLGKPYASLPVLKDGKAAFTDNAAEAKTFTDIYNNRSKPLPLVPAEDQYETTVGKAMNGLFATIATGGTVSRDAVKAALKTAQDQVAASVG